MAEAGSLFEGSATSYRAREPYAPAFFRQLAEHVALTAASRVLDLASGPGPVAKGLSPYCGYCLLVDASPEMLQEARRQHYAPGCKIERLQSRAEDLPSSVGCFDLVTIGRALHWLEPGPTLAALDRVARPGSFVAACWASTHGDHYNPWAPAFRAVRDAFRKQPSPRKRGPAEFFADSSFAPAGDIALVVRRTVPIGELVERVFSYSSASRAQLGDKAREMESELLRRLAPFEDDGRITEVVRNTAIVFQRR